MTERGNGGKFAKGMSGNRRGRPKSANKRLEKPEDLDEVIIDVMNMPTAVRTSAGEEIVSLFRATMLRLATGKADNRLAAIHAINLMRQAVWANQERMKRLEIERQYLREHGQGDAGVVEPVL